MTAGARCFAVILGLTVAGCASTPSEETTGSLLPRMPSLPSVGQFVPSFASAPSRVERIGSNLYRISASPTAFPDATQRETYAMLRAAEVAQETGGSHFSIVTLGGVGGSNISTGPIIVRVLMIEAGAEPPVGAVSAAETIQFYAHQFGRTPSDIAASGQLTTGSVQPGNVASAPSGGLPPLPNANWGPAADPAHLKPTVAAEQEGDPRSPVTRRSRQANVKSKGGAARAAPSNATTSGRIDPTERGTLPLLRGT